MVSGFSADTIAGKATVASGANFVVGDALTVTAGDINITAGAVIAASQFTFNNANQQSVTSGVVALVDGDGTEEFTTTHVNGFKINGANAVVSVQSGDWTVVTKIDLTNGTLHVNGGSIDFDNDELVATSATGTIDLNS